uniref:Uncharacterized protein n=1 Tax=Glossina pallidipes TaxID=7398 RepID=A0A1B0A1S2_GLOPL
MYTITNDGPTFAGAGLWVTSQGRSVVPAMVCLCHGKKNITRPSDVEGSKVPLAKSSPSTKAVFKPRVTASKAQPAPVAPPPIISTSNSSPDSHTLHKFPLFYRRSGDQARATTFDT